MSKQKQPSRGVLKKRCSENIQEIYRRTPMPKCGFSKVEHRCFPVNIAKYCCLYGTPPVHYTF